MNLLDIQNPKFLKDMTVSEMNELAQEIRSFLIENISKTGGHLASNLGVVELTIAMHYVFNSPEDKLFFDVGHQCYTHKILTGRAASFSHLRQYGGISGFEKRKESEHDVWEAGHSSTSLSAALGMAVARDLKGDDYNIVPLIGDGALGSGMAFEALNQIGAEKRKMVIIFNDNNMSISKNVGGMTMGISKLRAAKSYNNLKNSMKESLNRNELGKVMYHGLKNFKDSVKDNIVDTGLFGDFNLDYLGPVDGHNIRDLIRVLTVAKEHNSPVVVHVLTQKGRGYGPCENDRKGLWHGVGPFNIETGKQLSSTPSGYQSWSGVISDTLLQLADNDPTIVAMTPAMINGSALDHFFAKYPDRSFDCGIAEEHTATFAAGLAISGMRPFMSVYSSFLQRAYDQINHDICRMDLPVVIGIDRAGLVGSDGETHHGVFDIGFLKPIPNIILSEPRNAKEARDLLYTAFHQNHPFAIRYPKGDIPYNPDESFNEIKIGSWEVINDAPENRIYLLSYGPDVEKITSKVTINHLPVTIINCRFFKPMDEDVLNRIAGDNKKILVYETDMLSGGLTESILGYYTDHGMNIPLKRIGIHDNYVQHGAVNLLRKEQKIDLNILFDEVNKLLQ